MKAPPPSPRRGSVAEHFRGQIETAEGSGVSRDAMTLHLTLNDVNALQRDRSLAVSDISFQGGVMKFLGVKVDRGGVPASVLGLP